MSPQSLSSPSSAGISDGLLPHESHNEKAESTILLIHGACTTSKAFKPILPWLTSYHVLIPTLPGHGSTADKFGPLTLTNTMERLTELILARAHDRKAAIAGHSMGAMIGAHLATHRPDVVASAVWLSGAAFLPPSPLLPVGFALNSTLTYLVPNWLIDSVIDVKSELRGTVDWGDELKWVSWSLWRQIAAIMSTRLEDLVGISQDATSKGKTRPTSNVKTPADRQVCPAAKVLASEGVQIAVIAAVKGGLLPSNDNEKTAAEIAHALGGTAWRVLTMRHAWNLQDPELFATSVTRLIEGHDAPPPFQRIGPDQDANY